eukprot:TRINITY_DN17338_c0_g1_i1.p1 TRINITY_DN17338_c0_g1~~TRINITY_DN17338_c0_g1_i1.p1  ORF type:complete len:161 (+),score=31.76 TRINITY_DN17338_c0_g1_i1:143-625(+)
MVITPKAAMIVAVCTSAKLPEPHMLLIMTYRIPVESWVLEFPGGVNDGNDIESCALRELKEETGYVGKIRANQEALVGFTDPWKSDDDNAIIYVDIDLDNEANINPLQKLEPEENIKVIMVPIRNLKKEIEKLVKEKGLKVCNNVWAFAEGLELSQSLKL